MSKPAGDEHSHTFPLAITGSIHGAEGLTLSCHLEKSSLIHLIKYLTHLGLKIQKKVGITD